MNYKNINDLHLLVYDFDGVMTDNKLYLDEHGKEMVQCNRADGLGVNLIKEMGFPQMILSTEKNQVVAKRAEKLGVEVLHGVGDKKAVLIECCKDKGIELQNVLYVGNDTNDYEAMMLVGTRVCPADSHPEIKKISSFVTESKGGEGVVRELADWLSE